jgi:hypothetical protein
MGKQSPTYLQGKEAMKQEILWERREETKKRSQVSEIIRLSSWCKLFLFISKRLFAGYEKLPGWRYNLLNYVFYYLRYGRQTSYNHGFDKRLDCPLCSYSIGEYPWKMNI